MVGGEKKPTKNKLELRTKKIQADLFGGRRKLHLHEPLVQQLMAPHRGSEPLAVDRAGQ